MSDATSTIECGVVLHPAGHTRSPAMHNAAFECLGLAARYRAFDVPPQDLEQAIERFRAQGMRQLAVSIPHKESIIALLDEVDDVARTIGAVNTVTRVGDHLVGTNTDWLGALRALEREGSVEGQRAVILGAGGTARALLFGLRRQGCEVFVLNRTVDRARTLIEELGGAGAGSLEELAKLSPEILVNTTSVGLNEDRSPVPAEAVPAGCVVLDAVYAPARTALLAQAEARGARPVGGKWMLVYQAVEQLRIWTSALPEPPSKTALAAIPEVMAEAFDRAGREQQTRENGRAHRAQP